ncbi:MAG: hypothetical protein ABUS57_06400 [Pseudomonadota bacterium]
MPFWAYGLFSGLVGLGFLFLLFCLFKPIGFIKKRWHAAIAIFGLIVVCGSVLNIPPMRPDGISAENWTRRIALCRQLGEALPTCLSDSLAKAPDAAIAALEERVRRPPAPTPTKTDSQTTATTAVATSSKLETTTATTVVSSTPSSANWDYSDSVDEMRNAPIHIACTVSLDEVRLGFPYGNQHVELCVREHPRFGHDVYVHLESEGQFLCTSYDGCSVRVKFDNSSVETYSAAEASDNSSNVIFLQNYPRFVRNLKPSSHVQIEAEFYQAGVQQMTFATDGLVWPRHP